MRTALVLSLFLISAPALAADEVTDCDALAAHPEDPGRIVTGVPTSAVDKPAAIAACRAALEADPGNPRLTYQLARVLFYDGKNGEALMVMESAADAGYPQAQFVMGAFINNGRDGASTNICDAEAWWAKAAEGGREAAQVSYVRHVTKGLFDGCDLHADLTKMESFLAAAKDGARDYYLRLLLADLDEDFASYKAQHEGH